MELKGNARFQPSTGLGQSITVNESQPTMVAVRFGGVASGRIPVYRGAPTGNAGTSDAEPGRFQTPPAPTRFPAWGIPLTHPAFPAHRLARPMLWVEVHDSVVFGRMGWSTHAALAADPERFRETLPLAHLFGGLADYQDLHIRGQIVDLLQGGRLIYEADGLEFRSGPFHGTGRIQVRDESYVLAAGLDVPVSGLASAARIPIMARTTSPLDSVHGSASWGFNRRIGRAGRMRGTVTATVGRGLVDVRGTGRYIDPAIGIEGAVTLIVTSFDIAKENVRDRLGPDAPQTISPAAPGENLAVTGWGELDFALTEWLTGRAEVVLHPEGYVTARGALLPTAVIGLIRKRATEQELGSWALGIPVYGVPGVGDVRAEITASLSGHGFIGPGTLHDLRATGLVSNAPGIGHRLAVGGTIGAPALAALQLDVDLGLSGRFLHVVELVQASVRGTGTAEVQMIAEAAVLIGTRPSTADADVPEYFISGHLTSMAELLLRLSLGLRGRVALWRSKLALADRAWSLGQGALRGDFEYVLGRSGRTKSSFSLDFGAVDFDPGAFARAIARSQALEATESAGKIAAEATTSSDVAPGSGSPSLPLPDDLASPPMGPSTLTTSFDMAGQAHALELGVSGRPFLAMRSGPPSDLLGRIARVRRELRRTRRAGDPAAEPGLAQAQLATLAEIEAEAMQVLEAATRIAGATSETPASVPGLAALGGAIARFADRYGVTDLDSENGPGDSSAAPEIEVILRLPSEKAVHAALYRSMIRGRRLENTPSVPRHTAQANRWDQALRPGGAMEMDLVTWVALRDLLVPENRRLRPNWSRTSARVDMQVDHRVEWQVLGTDDRRWGDSMANYELLDQPSNGRSGNAIRQSICVERQRLADLTGDPSWLTQRIVFTRLDVNDGESAGERWLSEEIQDGDHYHAYVQHTQGAWR